MGHDYPRRAIYVAVVLGMHHEQATSVVFHLHNLMKMTRDDRLPR